MITGESTISIALIICIINIVLTLWSNFSGSSKDIRESVLKANMKLDMQCGLITNLQKDFTKVASDMESIKEEQIRQGMEIKAIWRNIDEIKSDDGR